MGFGHRGLFFGRLLVLLLIPGVPRVLQDRPEGHAWYNHFTNGTREGILPSVPGEFLQYKPTKTVHFSARKYPGYRYKLADKAVKNGHTSLGTTRHGWPARRGGQWYQSYGEHSTGQGTTNLNWVPGYQ